MSDDKQNKIDTPIMACFPVPESTRESDVITMPGPPFLFQHRRRRWVLVFTSGVTEVPLASLEPQTSTWEMNALTTVPLSMGVYMKFLKNRLIFCTSSRSRYYIFPSFPVSSFCMFFVWIRYKLKTLTTLLTQHDQLHLVKISINGFCWQRSLMSMIQTYTALLIRPQYLLHLLEVRPTACFVFTVVEMEML